MSELDIPGIVNGANEYRLQWLEPEPLPGGVPGVPAFNEHLLPDSLRSWIVDIGDRAQAPLDFPALGAMTALSSAIGRRFGIRPKRHDDWLVVPNLWGLIVGPPAFLKSPMLHEVLKPLARLEARHAR
jgi:putative DNA primase/helicase